MKWKISKQWKWKQAAIFNDIGRSMCLENFTHFADQERTRDTMTMAKKNFYKLID